MTLVIGDRRNGNLRRSETCSDIGNHSFEVVKSATKRDNKVGEKGTKI